jgi:hypothetical protein
MKSPVNGDVENLAIVIVLENNLRFHSDEIPC